MLKRFDFANKIDLANGLAEAVAKNLQAGIKAQGIASLAVSGGNTPKLFFTVLAKRADIDWSKIMITLVDERWVDVKSDRSNARLVQENLMQGAAAKASFVPLFSGGDAPSVDQVAEVNANYLAKMPKCFDAVILGMGNDGHTASFFPKGDSLSAALTQAGPAIAINAPGAGEARVTLTLPTLLNTKNLYLHIEGAEKQVTLEKALAGGNIEEMPVRAVLQQEKTLLTYWCP